LDTVASYTWEISDAVIDYHIVYLWESSKQGIVLWCPSRAVVLEMMHMVGTNCCTLGPDVLLDMCATNVGISMGVGRLPWIAVREENGVSL
jgi:hypothetical protein